MTPHAHVYSTPWLMLVAGVRRRVLLCRECGQTKTVGTAEWVTFDTVAMVTLARVQDEADKTLREAKTLVNA